MPRAGLDWLLLPDPRLPPVPGHQADGGVRDGGPGQRLGRTHPPRPGQPGGQQRERDQQPEGPGQALELDSVRLLQESGVRVRPGLPPALLCPGHQR